jgi:ribonuclease P protein component
LKRFSLKKHSILSKQADFSLVRQQGQKLVGKWLIAHFYKATDCARKVAFVVSKACGNSPERHKLKRRMREIYRHFQHQLPENMQSIWVARNSAGRALFTDLEQEMKSLCHKAGFPIEGK